MIDIRRPEEWRKTGIAGGSKTITFFDHRGAINPNFLNEFNAVTHKEKPVILIYRTVNRTQATSQAVAQQLGYDTAHNVTDVIIG